MFKSLLLIMQFVGSHSLDYFICHYISKTFKKASLPYSINFFHNIFQHARTLYPQHALFPRQRSAFQIVPLKTELLRTLVDRP